MEKVEYIRDGYIVSSAMPDESRGQTNPRQSLHMMLNRLYAIDAFSRHERILTLTAIDAFSRQKNGPRLDASN